MPRIHTIQRPAHKAQRQAKPSQTAPITKREFTAADAPKIALAAGLAVALLGAGWFSSGKANVQHEHERMMVQMQHESGAVKGEINLNLSPEEADEAQNERETNDPNFRP